MSRSIPKPVLDDGLTQPTDLLYRRLIGIHKNASQPNNRNKEAHIGFWFDGKTEGIILNTSGFQYTDDGMSSYSHEVFGRYHQSYDLLYEPYTPESPYLCAYWPVGPVKVLFQDISFNRDNPSYETSFYKRKTHVLVGTPTGIVTIEDSIRWKLIRKQIIAETVIIRDGQYDKILELFKDNNWFSPKPSQ